MNAAKNYSRRFLILRICLLPVALVLLSGCGDTAETRHEGPLETTGEAVSDAVEDTAEAMENAWNTVADFTAEQSDRLVSNMRDAHNDLRDRFHTRRTETDLPDQARENFEQASEAFQAQLDQAADASADAWDTTKEATREAWENLVKAYEDLGD